MPIVPAGIQLRQIQFEEGTETLVRTSPSLRIPPHQS